MHQVEKRRSVVEVYARLQPPPAKPGQGPALPIVEPLASGQQLAECLMEDGGKGHVLLGGKLLDALHQVVIEADGGSRHAYKCMIYMSICQSSTDPRVGSPDPVFPDAAGLMVRDEDGEALNRILFCQRDGLS